MVSTLHNERSEPGIERGISSLRTQYHAAQPARPARHRTRRLPGSFSGAGRCIWISNSGMVGLC
jgi:hypothetical protein